jgi:hypothetical protein
LGKINKIPTHYCYYYYYSCTYLKFESLLDIMSIISISCLLWFESKRVYLHLYTHDWILGYLLHFFICLEWDLKDYGCQVELYITFFDNHKVLFIIFFFKNTTSFQTPYLSNFLFIWSYQNNYYGCVKWSSTCPLWTSQIKTHGKKITNENECIDITKCLNTHPSPNIEPLFFYTLILFSSFCSI